MLAHMACAKRFEGRVHGRDELRHQAVRGKDREDQVHDQVVALCGGEWAGSAKGWVRPRHATGRGPEEQR